MSKIYIDENDILEEFQRKIENKSYTHEDIIEFKELFEGQAAESNVMMKISDRLQKRLDNANTKIREKNEEISSKNEKLKTALDNLMKAKVGKKASTIMFTVAILIFVSEELYLQPLVEYFIGYAYLILIFKGLVAIILKFFESILEKIFVNLTKKKIVENVRDEVSTPISFEILPGKEMQKQSSAA